MHYNYNSSPGTRLNWVDAANSTESMIQAHIELDGMGCCIKRL